MASRSSNVASEKRILGQIAESYLRLYEDVED